MAGRGKKRTFAAEASRANTRRPSTSNCQECVDVSGLIAQVIGLRETASHELVSFGTSGNQRGAAFKRLSKAEEVFQKSVAYMLVKTPRC
jgi:hypothetical protein